MSSFRPISPILLSVSLLVAGASCADEDTSDARGGESQGGSSTGGGSEGGTAPTGGGGSNVGGDPQGGQPEGGEAPGGASEGGGGQGEGGGSGLDPDLFPFETEDNGTLASADGLPDGAIGFQAELPTLNDIDVFAVFVPLGSTFRAQVTDGMGGCPPDANVTMQVYSPANLEIASQTGLCPNLDGNNDPDLTSIATEGTYFVRITTSQVVPFYVLEIEVAPPVCGDNITSLGEDCDDGNLVDGDGCEADCTETPVCGDGSVQVGEECDDGNLVAGDGCDGGCLLEGDYCPEAEPNNTTSAATVITTCSGGFGQIGAVGDLDYYEIDVTVPGSSLRVETVDITGTGCPAGFDSVVRVYNSGGAEIGSNDDGGTDACSLITPAANAFATNLAVGTYFISVEEFSNDATSPDYVVLIDVLAPGCGDGIFQAGEECDDGNLNSGDGCDATCQIEGNYCGELEPNDTTGTATILAGCDGGSGAVNAAGDLDYFAVEVTVAGSSIRAETTDVTGIGCGGGLNTVIRLYSPAGVELGVDDDDGNVNCSLINPTVDVFARNLPIGTYYVRVEESGNNATTPPWLLKVLVNPPGCGDGIVQAAEECDDSNTVNGDGCDDQCLIEGSFCFESEPNDTFVLATPLTVCDGGAGQINFVGDSDWFSFEITTPGAGVRLEVVDVVGSGCPTGFDSFLRLYNSAMVQLGTDDNDGNNPCSLISPSLDPFASNLPVGTYYVRVEESGNDAVSNPYLLLVDILLPGCGDGVPQVGEECDDGNAVLGDGCDTACLLEAGYCAEVEPNETTATANDANGCTYTFARIGQVNDQDYFRIDLAVAGSDLRLETYGTTSTLCPAGTDTLLTLFDTNGVQLGSNDDGGDVNCSLINPAVDAYAANLAAGTYYVRMHEFFNDGTTPPLRINIQVLP